MSKGTSKSKHGKTRSKKTSRVHRHRGGGHSGNLQSIVGPILGEIKTLPDLVTRRNTRRLLKVPLVSQLGQTVIPKRDLIRYTMRHSVNKGGKRKHRASKKHSKRKSGRSGKKGKQSGGGLASGPLQQTYDYLKGDAMRVYDALGGFANELKDLNVTRDAKKILPEWMV